jgi:hypothetical protein
MQTSYFKEDVILLLKDISGLVEPLPTKEREKLIQQGRHYCEMLPIEYVPSERYMKAYQEALSNYGKITAHAVGSVAEKILKAKGPSVVLVSLARAGTPIGILIKRYLKNKYNLEVPHYTLSIIRGRGIDHQAMKCMLETHEAKDLQFVDGWTGKGAILGELKKEVSQYKGVSDSLAVLADPAHVTQLYGTQEDFLIPSSCLNATVSGLISRTFLRGDIIGKDDFHGAVFYKDLLNEDKSYEFIDTIESNMVYEDSYYKEESSPKTQTGLEEVKEIAKVFEIKNINLIKPGIGETTRVLLRRVPYAVLVKDIKDKHYIDHIIRLAEEKDVKIMEYPLKNYRACGIIKALSPDL